MAAPLSIARSLLRAEFAWEIKRISSISDGLIKDLHLRPDIFQVRLKSTAKINVKVFITTSVGMFHMSNRFNALEVFAIAASVAAQDDHCAAVIVARTPDPVAVVLTDGLRQPISGTIKINRC